MRRVALLSAAMALIVTGIAACGSPEPVADAPPPSPVPTEVAVAEVPALTSTPPRAATATDPTAETTSPPGGSELDCADPAESTVEWAACNVFAGIRSRNLAALRGYMEPDFSIGLWRSEWSTTDPESVIAELSESRLARDPAAEMPFTTDRSAFPSLDGVAPETLLGAEAPVVLVAYGRGWEFDGAGEALLFFTEPEPGRFRWSGLLLAPVGFD